MLAWEEFLKRLDGRFGKEVIDKWVRPLRRVHFDACNLYLEAKDTFYMLWFEEHIRPLLKKDLVNNNGHQIKVHLTVLGTKAKEKRIEIPRSFILRTETLDPWAIFANFVLEKPNEVPFKVLEERTLAPGPPLFFHGPAGCGKSHLLMALAEKFEALSAKVFYLHAETFTDHVVSAIRNSQMQEFRESYRKADVLIMDDIDVLAKRGATQEELFHTFNALHAEGKQLVFAARSAPVHLAGIEERLISRFEWGLCLSLVPLSKEGLQLFIERYTHFLNFPIHTVIIEFLLETFSSIKSLKRAIDALVLRCHLEKIVSHKNVLGTDMVKKLLEDLIEKEKKSAITPERIVKAVADHFGILPEDILGKSQTRESTLGRQLSMELARELLKLPYMQIGSIFSRDHSTVMTSIKQIEKKLNEKDADISFAHSEAKRRIQN